MLEQLDLTDDERQALEGDREAITALAAKLADGPTPSWTGTQPARPRADPRHAWHNPAP
jgi:hypothetical protein